MASSAPKRRVGSTIIALLALVQSLLGALRAFQWLDVGSDLSGQGLLIMPAIGLLAIGRGIFVGMLTLLFVAFAGGAMLQQHWARWLGIFLSIVTLLLVAAVLIEGEALGRALVWAIIPVVMICYLISSSARQAFTADYDKE